MNLEFVLVLLLADARVHKHLNSIALQQVWNFSQLLNEVFNLSTLDRSLPEIEYRLRQVYRCRLFRDVWHEAAWIKLSQGIYYFPKVIKTALGLAFALLMTTEVHNKQQITVNYSVLLSLSIFFFAVSFLWVKILQLDA